MLSYQKTVIMWAPTKRHGIFPLLFFYFYYIRFIGHSECTSIQFTRETLDCTTLDKNYLVKPNVSFRNGLIDPNRLWKNNFDVLPDEKFDEKELGIIEKAIWTIGQILPCLCFKIHSQLTKLTGDYVLIVMGGSNTGCNADIGRRGSRQFINLEVPGCMTLDIVMHEMLHDLGLYHEHARYDRDEYVNTLWENIRPDKIHNFQAKSNVVTNTYGVPYNILSLMHYKSKSFSKNGQPTILGKNGEQVGSIGILQQTDTDKLQKMHKW